MLPMLSLSLYLPPFDVSATATSVQVGNFVRVTFGTFTAEFALPFGQNVGEEWRDSSCNLNMK